jgi:membrane-bound metal-dependent hydrolase YbcI (DUF457 family)
MPSPIGHAIAGVALSWAAQGIAPRLTPDLTSLRQDLGGPPEQQRKPSVGPAPTFVRKHALTLTCVALAVLPDIDLLYMPLHRRMTHSVGAVLVVFIVATAVTGWVTRRFGTRAVAIGVVCAAAVASHVLMDWLSLDAQLPYGVQALWPFTDQWYIAPRAIFPGTERRELLAAWSQTANARAIVWEVGVMTPIAAAAGIMRRYRSRGPTSVRDDQRRPSA